MKGFNYIAWKSLLVHWKQDTQSTVPKEHHAGYIRGCVGKFAYPDYLSALYAASALNSDLGRKKNTYIWVYSCPICQSNHLGNMSLNPKRAVNSEFYGKQSPS